MSPLAWTDVDDELPPRGIDVLIACADGVQQGVLRGNGFRSYLRGDVPVHDVTHWMALPAHPANDDEAMVAATNRNWIGRRGRAQRLM